MAEKQTPSQVVAVCISDKKGIRKTNVCQAMALVDHGLENDAHAANWHRQISLLALESIEKMRQMGLNVGPGDFAENITTKGIVLVTLPIGTHLQIGATEVEVTQIGKECHTRCAIFQQAGDCVMPREGIFVKVLAPGMIKEGDTITVLSPVRPEAAGE